MESQTYTHTANSSSKFKKSQSLSESITLLLLVDCSKRWRRAAMPPSRSRAFFSVLLTTLAAHSRLFTRESHNVITRDHTVITRVHAMITREHVAWFTRECAVNHAGHMRDRRVIVMWLCDSRVTFAWLTRDCDVIMWLTRDVMIHYN